MHAQSKAVPARRFAAPGWDASTGLGTPNYGLLLNALDELDSLREQKLMTTVRWVLKNIVYHTNS